MKKWLAMGFILTAVINAQAAGVLHTCISAQLQEEDIDVKISQVQKNKYEAAVTYKYFGAVQTSKIAVTRTEARNEVVFSNNKSGAAELTIEITDQTVKARGENALYATLAGGKKYGDRELICK
jgi:hypothetical protein